MLDILVWMWHDPQLQGSRGTRNPNPGPIIVPEVRYDMQIPRRLARKRALAGKAPGTPPEPPRLPPGAPSPPRFFKPEHVVRLAQLFKKHLPVEHRFVCICDEVPTESNGVTWIQTPATAAAAGAMRSPEGNRFPSCYRRLWAQSEDAAKILSPRVLLGDIDMIPVADLSPIVNRPEPFVGWRPFRDWGAKMRIGGGLYLFTPGAHAKVWTDFIKNPHAAVAEARAAGFRGSDQAWLSHKLAGKVPVYGRDSGLYSIRDLGHGHVLPKDARLVQFNGPIKPWDYRGPAGWIQQHWSAGVRNAK
jgi:hypothetical protein